VSRDLKLVEGVIENEWRPAERGEGWRGAAGQVRAWAGGRVVGRAGARQACARVRPEARAEAAAVGGASRSAGGGGGRAGKCARRNTVRTPWRGRAVSRKRRGICRSFARAIVPRDDGWGVGVGGWRIARRACVRACVRAGVNSAGTRACERACVRACMRHAPWACAHAIATLRLPACLRVLS